MDSIEEGLDTHLLKDLRSMPRDHLRSSYIQMTMEDADLQVIPIHNYIDLSKLASDPGQWIELRTLMPQLEVK